MAVQDHLRTATTELLKAADLVKQDIESLRKDKTIMTQDRQIAIAQRLDNVRNLEHEQTASPDSDVSAQLQRQVQRLVREVADLRSEIRARERDIESAIRDKSGLVESLEAKARSIQP